VEAFGYRDRCEVMRMARSGPAAKRSKKAKPVEVAAEAEAPARRARASKDEASKDGSAKDVATKDVATKDVAAKGVAAKGGATKRGARKAGASEDAAPKRGAAKSATKRGAAKVAPEDAVMAAAAPAARKWKSDWLDKKTYEKELAKLQVELVKLQAWVQQEGLRVVVLFEGRDAAGKGGTIKRVTESLNPRYCRVVALPKPTERERTQWYFQRYVEQLPAAGEIALFDRSWYNRAGVERVMGFCTDEEYQEFFRTCPEFERMLVRSGTILIKYWFSVSPEEQERRFQSRLERVTKHWKLSPMDLEARQHWVEYSRAKDTMFAYTDIKQAPWYVVGADDKRRARLNCISHLLSMIPFQDVIPRVEALPPRDDVGTYVRPPMAEQTFVPERY
jgi:polyphosphate kinase